MQASAQSEISFYHSSVKTYHSSGILCNSSKKRKTLKKPAVMLQNQSGRGFRNKPKNNKKHYAKAHY